MNIEKLRKELAKRSFTHRKWSKGKSIPKDYALEALATASGKESTSLTKVYDPKSVEGFYYAVTDGLFFYRLMNNKEIFFYTFLALEHLKKENKHLSLPFKQVHEFYSKVLAEIQNEPVFN